MACTICCVQAEQIFGECKLAKGVWFGGPKLTRIVVIGAMLFILTTFLNVTIQREAKILQIEAVLGDVQIHSSTVKWSNFGKLQILVFVHLVSRF